MLKFVIILYVSIKFLMILKMISALHVVLENTEKKVWYNINSVYDLDKYQQKDFQMDTVERAR